MWFKYERSRFEASTIERLADYFRDLLASMVANPRQPVATLDVVPDDDSQPRQADTSLRHLDEAEEFHF